MLTRKQRELIKSGFTGNPKYLSGDAVKRYAKMKDEKRRQSVANAQYAIGRRQTILGQSSIRDISALKLRRGK